MVPVTKFRLARAKAGSKIEVSKMARASRAGEVAVIRESYWQPIRQPLHWRSRCFEPGTGYGHVRAARDLIARDNTGPALGKTASGRSRGFRDHTV